MLAGQPGLSCLPLSVLEVCIFTHCDISTQGNLARSSKVFWHCYKSLECDSIGGLTACIRWRIQNAAHAANILASRFYAQVQLLPLRPSLAPDKSMTHATFLGSFDESHLAVILQCSSWDEQVHLQALFAEALVRQLGCFTLGAGDDDVFLLTLKVYHNMQTGFSDADLDTLGKLFAKVPKEFAYWLDDELQQIHTVLCEPSWKLLDPAGSATHMYWDFA